MKPRLTLVILALLGLSVPVAQAAEKNVIFYIADDLGAYLGCYGYPQAKTPHMDALAADGTLFSNAYATTASCSASRSVIMTGLHNHANGHYGHQHAYHHFSCYPNVAPFALPRVMEGAGYRTGHIGKHHVAPDFIFRYGTMLKGNSRNPVEMVDKSLEFMGADTESPFLLYIGCSDPHRGGGKDMTNEHEPDLFGNKPEGGSFPGVTETFYEPDEVFVPPFLPDTPACRAELVHYYQSVSRVDTGLGHLVAKLKELGIYDKTMIIVTSDHGMAFPGGKTTVYEPGLRVPFIVRNPYVEKRGVKCAALISHTDITPTILDFAGGLNSETNAPKKMLNARKLFAEKGLGSLDNTGPKITSYHGQSWLDLLDQEDSDQRRVVYGSHTFHEIQMYYPMRVVRDQSYKLIWNIAHPLPYPFASDLWAAATWQAQWKLGPDANYGTKTVGDYVQRPEFELYDMQYDPDERKNLADDPKHQATLEEYKARLKQFQKDFKDPWIMKWDYE